MLIKNNKFRFPSIFHFEGNKNLMNEMFEYSDDVGIDFGGCKETPPKKVFQSKKAPKVDLKTFFNFFNWVDKN
jgi:hypothetical protein